jgi:protein-tyrosine phosphatase
MNTLFDIHSHVVPGVDDGAPDLAAATAMLAALRAAGTRTLWATPHLADELGYSASPERRALIAERFASLAPVCPEELTLRRGCEVTPSRERLAAGEDVASLALEGLDVVLVDGPDDEPADHDELILPYIARVQAEGLRAVLAHPERRAAHERPDPGYAERMVQAGALLQVDACALLGGDGPVVEAEAWRLVCDGLAVLVASDAHELGDCGDLSRAHSAISERVHPGAADRLCGGSALMTGAHS